MEKYIVYVAPEVPTDEAAEIGRFSAYRAAERAARRAVAGPRGATSGCVPACAPPGAIDGFADRDGGDDAQCSWIEQSGTIA